MDSDHRFLVLAFICASLFVWLVTMGVAVFFVLCVGCVVPVLLLLVVLIFSCLWGLVFIQFGLEFGGVLGAVVVGGFGGLLSFGLHFSGLIGFQDSVS